VDLDLYKADGAASYAALVAELGELPPTWRSSARSDQSGIRLFHVPAGVVWAERRAGPGIELIHTDQRYAVVWPSIHPDGGGYRWNTPAGDPAFRLPRVDEFPALPAAWQQRLSATPIPRPARSGRPGNTHPPRLSYAEASLAAACADIAAMPAGSGRNNALNRKAFALAGLGIDPDRIRAGLYAAAEANGYVAAHGPRAALATIESGLRAGAARPRTRP
jgi:hypothetical protein